MVVHVREEKLLLKLQLHLNSESSQVTLIEPYSLYG